MTKREELVKQTPAYKAAKLLIEMIWAHDPQWQLSINDGEGWVLTRQCYDGGRGVEVVLSKMITTDGDAVKIFNRTGGYVGTFFLIYEVDQQIDEVINDHSSSALMEQLWRKWKIKAVELMQQERVP